MKINASTKVPFLGITMGVLILMAMASPSARATLLTYYNFEGATPLTSDGGQQSTSITDTSGIVSVDNTGVGTNVNAITPPDSTTRALFTVPVPGVFPTSSFTLGGLTTTGLTDVVLSFALLSSANVGFTSSFTTLDLAYSTDGGANFSAPFATFTNLTSYTIYTGPPTFSFDVPAAVDNISGGQVFFEFAFSGFTLGSSETLIDNIQVNAAVVPEPSSYIGGLFGLVGLCWYQRRRFMRLLSLRSA